jgi:hypothetical protein
VCADAHARPEPTAPPDPEQHTQQVLVSGSSEESPEQIPEAKKANEGDEAADRDAEILEQLLAAIARTIPDCPGFASLASRATARILVSFAAQWPGAAGLARVTLAAQDAADKAEPTDTAAKIVPRIKTFARRVHEDRLEAMTRAIMKARQPLHVRPEDAYRYGPPPPASLPMSPEEAEACRAAARKAFASVGSRGGGVDGPRVPRPGQHALLPVQQDPYFDAKAVRIGVTRNVRGPTTDEEQDRGEQARTILASSPAVHLRPGGNSGGIGPDTRFGHTLEELEEDRQARAESWQTMAVLPGISRREADAWIKEHHPNPDDVDCLRDFKDYPGLLELSASRAEAKAILSAAIPSAERLPRQATSVQPAAGPGEHTWTCPPTVDA